MRVDACRTCRGVWLDRGELDKILEREAQAFDRRDEDDEAFLREVTGGGGRPRPAVAANPASIARPPSASSRSSAATSTRVTATPATAAAARSPSSTTSWGEGVAGVGPTLLGERPASRVTRTVCSELAVARARPCAKRRGRAAESPSSSAFGASRSLQAASQMARSSSSTAAAWARGPRLGLRPRAPGADRNVRMRFTRKARARRREFDLLVVGPWACKPCFDRLIAGSSGGHAGGHNCRDRTQAPTAQSRIGDSEVGTHERRFACASRAESAHCRRFACRRRDSNPRHADYDGHQGGREGC